MYKANSCRYEAIDQKAISTGNLGATSPGCFMINFDDSFIDNEKIGIWGFVIRDNNGHVILAGAGLKFCSPKEKLGWMLGIIIERQTLLAWPRPCDRRIMT